MTTPLTWTGVLRPEFDTDALIPHLEAILDEQRCKNAVMHLLLSLSLEDYLELCNGSKLEALSDVTVTTATLWYAFGAADDGRWWSCITRLYRQQVLQTRFVWHTDDEWVQWCEDHPWIQAYLHNEKEHETHAYTTLS